MITKAQFELLQPFEDVLLRCKSGRSLMPSERSTVVPVFRKVYDVKFHGCSCARDNLKRIANWYFTYKNSLEDGK